MSAQAMPQESGSAPESITMTVAELQQLVMSMVVRCLGQVGVELPDDVITQAVATQAGDLARQPRESEPERPAPPDPGDPCLVCTTVLRPLCENLRDYKPGDRLYVKAERGERLVSLGLVTLDASTLPPAPPPVPDPPASSGLSMKTAPGMIWR